MKKSVRIVTVLMLVAVMALSLTACGIDINKVAGKWHVESVNGKSAADFAAEFGSIEAGVQKVVDISEKETSITAIIDGAVSTSKGETVIRSNGIEATIDGTLFPFKYDEEKDTLSYSIDVNGTQYDYIYSRGDFDFSDLSGSVAGEQAAAEEYTEEGEYAEEYEEEE
ncbi:MAG: hypothetical protein K6F93_06820 [Lachnospiraceae bacterium]|nr:hypothetical protein [Lachnospiraceae bacterium]